MVEDLGNGVLKSLVFGFTVTFVALLQGFAPSPRLKVFPVPPRAPWSCLVVGAGAGLPAHRNHVQHLRPSADRGKKSCSKEK
jgi:hypothetical protein